MATSQRLRLLMAVVIGLSAWSTRAAWPHPRIDCGECGGTRRITCETCRGAGRFCPDCKGEKTRCEDCKGTGRLSCARCDGKRAFACATCGGAGRSWVPQRKLWVKEKTSGKGGIQYQPAHWEDCGSCDGNGKVACGDCGGRGATKCSICQGKGSLGCETCRGKASDRPECTRCEGRGWLRCKACEEREADAARLGAAVGPDLALFHAAIADIDASPPLKPLLAVARVGATGNPWGIVVLRAALGAKHRWVRALALDELEGFGASDLAQIGGPELATRLIGLAGGSTDSARHAQSLLVRLAREQSAALYRDPGKAGWRLERARYPAGVDLPPLPALKSGPAKPDSVASATPPAGSPRGRTGVAPKPQAPPGDEPGPHFGPESRGLPSFDLVWAIDCTGSMQSSFKEAVSIVDGTNGLLRELLGAQRVGLVGYRDKVETKLPVTDDPGRVRAVLSTLRADRGGTPDEGVDIALQAAFDAGGMGLKAGPAVVVVVGDSGPAAARVPALLAGLRAFRAAQGKRKLHALAVPTGGAVSSFWNGLAMEGGGQVLPFDGRSSVESLCLALLDGVDRVALARVLQSIAGK